MSTNHDETKRTEASNPLRRRFGRTLLLGLPALGVAAIAAAQPGEAQAAGEGDSWKMEGNSNVDDNDFLGTKINKPLVFKTNNSERMRIAGDGSTQMKENLSVVSSKFTAIRGETAGTGAIGVFGIANKSESLAGVFGAHLAGGVGVRGTSDTSIGKGKDNIGVLGESVGGTGVVGMGNTGMIGISSSGNGVVGIGIGVGSGIVGKNDSGQGHAGFFFGKVRVSGNLEVFGTLSKGGGSFKIDHPLDPQNKYLYHSFVESPDMMNIYNGIVTTDAAGNATVTMPTWFEALNSEFRYQLTVIGQFAQAIVSREIAGNQFSITTDKPNVKVSWQVTGIRQDAWARANRIPVEQDKPAEDRGTYLHPEAQGQPKERGENFRRAAALDATNSR